jgi:hypothetical protein
MDGGMWCVKHRAQLRNVGYGLLTCHGYDGEGCETTVSIADLLTPIGTITEPFEFTWTVRL